MLRYDPNKEMPPAELVTAAFKVAAYMREHDVVQMCGLKLDRPTNDEMRRQLGPTGKEKTRHG